MIFEFWMLASLAIASPVPSLQSGQASAGQVSRERLDSYADAFVRISELRRQLRQQVATLSPTQRPMLQEQLARGVSEALVQAGLDQAEFNAISKQIESDPELRRRARQRVMEKAVDI